MHAVPVIKMKRRRNLSVEELRKVGMFRRILVRRLSKFCKDVLRRGGDGLQPIKSPISDPRFVLALAGIRRLVVHIQAIEKDDSLPDHLVSEGVLRENGEGRVPEAPPKHYIFVYSLTIYSYIRSTADLVSEGVQGREARLLRENGEGRVAEPPPKHYILVYSLTI